MHLLRKKIQQYYGQPDKRWRQLMWGVAVFFPGVLLLYIASTFQWQWLFFLGALIMILGIVISLPAYLALLLWRLTNVKQPKDTSKR